MKVSIVLRSPFLDKIPSLKNLIIYLAEHGAKVKVISTIDINYPQTIFSNRNIKVINSVVRTKKMQLPTMVGLTCNVIKDIFFDKSDLYIGGDAQSCKLLYDLRSLRKFLFWDFLLEYPELDDIKDKLVLKSASKIITHDQWHSDFLNRNFGTSDSQFLYLPNSTFTKEVHTDSKFLHQRLGLNENQHIILHSGGLGKWFLCQEFAQATRKLREDAIVVFHTSHNTTGTSYFKDIQSEVINNKLPVKFSLQPVSDEELDNLVASATIGTAFYSVDILGYKAENMGVAAGKIGNYLKCGVPVICTNLPSLQYIRDYGCGILIDSFDQLNEAIDKTLSNLDEYKANAYTCYEELWEPTAYLKKIYKSIHDIRNK